MKKLFIFSILFFLAVSVFANPTIPIIDSYFKTVNKDFDHENILSFVSDSGQNLYKLFAIKNDREYTIEIDNVSYITGIQIVLSMSFSTELQFYTIYNNIDTSNIENEFSRLRKMLIKANVEPITSLKEDNKTPEKVLYIGVF